MCQENAIIVIKKLKEELIQRVKGFFVIKNVIPNFGEINFLIKNNTPIKVFSKKDNLNGFILQDIGNLILKELHILKQDDMQDKEMPKVLILLKNGKNFAENIIGDALNAISGKNLRKTISNLFRLAEVIIFQTFNHFVGRAIVASGSFNIYENKELLND